MKIEADPPYDKRLDDEGPRAWAAFCCYRDLGLNRSIDKAYAEYLEQRQNNGQTAPGKTTSAGKRAPRHWQEWSAANDWTRRTESYDADLDQKHRAAAEAEHLQQLAREDK